MNSCSEQISDSFLLHVEMHRCSNLACFSLQHKRARYAIHSYATSSTQLLNGSTVVKYVVVIGGSYAWLFQAGVRGRVRDAPCATVGLKVDHVDEAPCVSMCKKRRGICT